MSVHRVPVHKVWGEHPGFDPAFDQMEFVADSGHLRIWRYIDFWKLVDLVDSRELRFTRLDQFTDSLEGTKSRVAWERDIRVTFDRAIREGFPPTQAGIQAAREVALDVESVDRDFTRVTTFASCWHMSEVFNPSLWSTYTKKPNPVAIESTVERLVFAANYQPGSAVVHVRPITYIDHACDDMDNWMKHLFKDREYEFERELRAHLYDAGHGLSMSVLLARPTFKRSPCNLARLLAAIHVPADFALHEDLLGHLRNAALEHVPLITHREQAAA